MCHVLALPLSLGGSEARAWTHSFLGSDDGLGCILVVTGWLLFVLLIRDVRRRHVSVTRNPGLLRNDWQPRLYRNEGSGFQNSEVRPGAWLTEDAEELAVDGPEPDWELGGGSEKKSLIDGNHFHACYTRCVRPAPQHVDHLLLLPVQQLQQQQQPEASIAIHRWRQMRQWQFGGFY